MLLFIVAVIVFIIADIADPRDLAPHHGARKRGRSGRPRSPTA